MLARAGGLVIRSGMVGLEFGSRDKGNPRVSKCRIISTRTLSRLPCAQHTHTQYFAAIASRNAGNFVSRAVSNGWNYGFWFGRWFSTSHPPRIIIIAAAMKPNRPTRIILEVETRGRRPIVQIGNLRVNAAPLRVAKHTLETPLFPDRLPLFMDRELAAR